MPKINRAAEDLRLEHIISSIVWLKNNRQLSSSHSVNIMSGLFRRKLSIISEESEEPLLETGERKRCKLLCPDRPEWKFAFELNELEYQTVQTKAQAVLDVLFGLVFCYESGQIHAILSSIVFVQCEYDTNWTGIDGQTLGEMELLTRTFDSFAYETLLRKFTNMIPFEYVEIINRLLDVFDTNSACLTGIIRQLLCCLPLAKLKALSTLTLFMKQICKRFSNLRQLSASILHVPVRFIQLITAQWEQVFLVPCQ